MNPLHGNLDKKFVFHVTSVEGIKPMLGATSYVGFQTLAQDDLA
jgi:hypothetical protein